MGRKQYPDPNKGASIYDRPDPELLYGPAPTPFASHERPPETQSFASGSARRRSRSSSARRGAGKGTAGWFSGLFGRAREPPPPQQYPPARESYSDSLRGRRRDERPLIHINQDSRSVNIGQFQVFGRYDGRPTFQLRKRLDTRTHKMKLGVDVDLATGRLRTLAKYGRATPMLGVEGRPVPEMFYGSIRLFGDKKVQMRLSLGYNFRRGYPTMWFRMKATEDLRPRLGVGQNREDWSRPVDERAPQGGFDYRWKFRASATSIVKVNTGIDLLNSSGVSRSTPVQLSIHNVKIKQYITSNPFSKVSIKRLVDRILGQPADLPAPRRSQKKPTKYSGSTMNPPELKPAPQKP